MTEEVLAGGVANAGAVVRRGDVVLRPRSPHAASIDALLLHVRARGFLGAPEPLGVAPDGRERLRWIPGDVPVPPYPPWSLRDAALASAARLLRALHDATVDFEPPPGARWSDEMADPRGPHEVICHNDVCPENVVYRDGEAVALLDFDFAAPGRRTYDIASFARMCVPLEAPEDAARSGRRHLDPFSRLRLVADAYGLQPGGHDLLEAIADQVEAGGEFVRRRVEAGQAAFIEMWEATGGQARYDRRRAWFRRERSRFAAALG